jgi:type II secretory pathway pseudopilin PulG
MSGSMTSRRYCQAGLSYVEALVAVAVLAVALIPALDSLQTAFTSAAVHEQLRGRQQQLANRMEMLAAEPFSSLDQAAQAAGGETVASSHSDPVGPDRVLVFLSRYDGDNDDGDDDPFSGTEEGLIWVRVAMENTPHELITLVAR